MKTVPIRVAKQIAKEFDCDQVIVLAWSKKTGMTHVVSYGKTTLDCDQAAGAANKMKKALGWPDHLCEATPARMKKVKG